MIDLSVVKKSGSRHARPATSARDIARCLVAEYLHDWGLLDPEIVAAESRRIVEQAESLCADVPVLRLEQELCSTAIRITSEEVEASIQRMANSPFRSRLHRLPVNGSIVPRMASVLMEFPDAIRHRDRPPARLLGVLERSVAPIVPQPKRREMLPQPRTRLWKILRKGYWRQVSRRVRRWASRRAEKATQ